MSSTNTTSTTDEGLVLPVIPNEWLDYLFHQQQFLDDLDVPFVGGSSDAAVSDDTSFGDDIFSVPGGGGGGNGGCCYDTAASLKVSGCDETMYLLHDLTGTASPTISGTAATVFNPENSTAASNNSTHVDLSPKAAIAKQVKRRSRASRRTPTTLLNASIKNFRALVQQYTGCQSSNSGFDGKRKGPIILNFGGRNDRNEFPASFGNYHYSRDQIDHQQCNQIYGGQQGRSLPT